MLHDARHVHGNGVDGPTNGGVGRHVPRDLPAVRGVPLIGGRETDARHAGGIQCAPHGDAVARRVGVLIPPTTQPIQADVPVRAHSHHEVQDVLHVRAREQRILSLAKEVGASPLQRAGSQRGIARLGFAEQPALVASSEGAAVRLVVPVRHLRAAGRVRIGGDLHLQVVEARNEPRLEQDVQHGSPRCLRVVKQQT